MKKVVLSVISALFVLVMSVHTNFALTADESYNLARQYWNSVAQLEGADEVVTYASLGLDASQKPLGENVVSGNVAKVVIALTLHGDDPRSYNGVNYVEMLENYVHDNGAFDKDKDVADATSQVYGVYALYVVNSEKAELAADYLVSLANDEGAFGYAGVSDTDTTGWVVEALTLVNQTKYQTTIDNAISYLLAQQNSNAEFISPFVGSNPCTQACVLMGLLTYDAQGVKGTTYNQGDKNPYDVVLSFQNNDGSFWYNQAGEDNSWATLQASQVVGYYVNGSVYKIAANMYQKLINNENKEPEKDNQQKPVVSEPQPKEETKVNEDKKEQEKTKKIVNTADDSQIALFASLMLASGYVIVKGRKSIG